VIGPGVWQDGGKGISGRIIAVAGFVAGMVTRLDLWDRASTNILGRG